VLSFKSSNTHCNIATLYTCTQGGDTQAEAEVAMGIGKTICVDIYIEYIIKAFASNIYYY